MIGGDPIEEESMTAALRPADLQLADRQDLTVDDVVNLPEDLHYELIDGRLVLTPAALPIHQNIGFHVMSSLRANCPANRYVSLDQSVILDGRNERRPDVVAVRAEAANRSPLLVTDVLLAVEIISRSSRVSDREDKMKAYAYAGIPAYWIIDPLADSVTFAQFTLEAGGEYRCVTQTDETLTVDQPWLVALDPPAWTRERDWLTQIARPDR
jgi:Uma2 family endonuclease